MCWSAPVSFLFGVIDVLMISFLLWRRYGRDVTYACLLGSVALQEWAQFAVWATKSALLTQDDCSLGKTMIGFGTFVGSQSIPAVLVWRSVVDNRRSSSKLLEENEEARQSLQVKASLLWFSSTLLVLGATVLTKSYCVMVGQRHHQVWICAQSVYKLGGFPLYFASLAIYAIAIQYGLSALELPHKEHMSIVCIGLVCGIVSYGLYFYTLEACSVWCWSAFSVGMYLYLRPVGKAD